jgi:hypothetical protein
MDFHVQVSGEVESALFMDYVRRATCFFEFCITQETGWRMLAGEQSGRSPACDSSSTDFVWNIPFRLSLAAKTPAGWPHMLLRVTCSDWRGREVVYGYGLVSIPCQPGRHSRKVTLLAPPVSSWWNWVSGLMMGQRPTVVDPESFFLKTANKESVVLSPTGSEITVNFTIALKDAEKLNLKFCYPVDGTCVLYDLS